MKHLPLDSQTPHSTKTHPSTTDYSIVPGQTLLTLGRTPSHRRCDPPIQLKPSTEGTPYLILRMNQQQQSKIIPLLAAKYPVLYHPSLLGYLFLQADPDELLTLIYDSGLELHLLMRRDSHLPEGTHPLLPETIPYDLATTFVRILADPLTRFSIAPQPLSYYAEGNTPLICVDGPLKGLTGYIVRTHRTRRLIFQISPSLTASTDSLRSCTFLPLSQYEAEK